MISALGLSYDPTHHCLSGARGQLELEPHVGRVLAALMAHVDQVVSRGELLLALVGDSGLPSGIPLNDLLRSALKDVRALCRLVGSGKLMVSEREAERFVLHPQRVGTPAVLRRERVLREPHVNVSIRARLEAEARQAARAAAEPGHPGPAPSEAVAA